MSRDLSFWRYVVRHEDHYDVYQRLSDGEMVEGVAMLPIKHIRSTLYAAFSDWKRLDDDHLDLNGRELIEIFTTEQFVRFDCYDVSEDNMNRLIDLMLLFNCCLYDSLIDERFE